MKESERDKLIELTKRALSINKELLAEEKKFIKAASSGEEVLSLAELNEKLNELCRKEHLYLSASKSLLRVMNKE